MNSRIFTTLIGEYHRNNLGKILFLEPSHNGIDLIGDIGVEVKSRYKKYSHRWAVHDYQYKLFEKENKGKELFWAFVLYDLSKDVGKINHNRIGMYVKDIEALIVPWNFVSAFEVHRKKTGDYRYIAKEDIDLSQARRLKIDKTQVYFV